MTLGVEQVGGGLGLAELGLEGGKEGSGPDNEFLTDIIFLRSPGGSEEEFRRQIIVSGKGILGVDVFSETLNDFGEIGASVSGARAEFYTQSEEGAKVERRFYLVVTKVVASHSLWALEVEPAWHVGDGVGNIMRDGVARIGDETIVAM
jgi:hypothetical protein